MSGVTLDIKVSGPAAIERALAKLSHRLPLMRAIGAWLESSTRERFETNIAPDGQRWQPSLAAKRRGTPTLVEFGQLRDSYTHTASEDEAAVGTNKIYAAIHHFGGIIRAKSSKGLRFPGLGGGWVNVQQVSMPARPQLGVSRDDEAEIGDLVRRFAAGAWS